MTGFHLHLTIASLLVTTLVTAGCATQSRLDESAAATEADMAVADSPLGAELATFDAPLPPSSEDGASTAGEAAAGDVVLGTPPAGTADAAADTASPAPESSDAIVTVTLDEPVANAPAVSAPAAAAPLPPVATERPLYDGPLPYTSEIAQSIVGSRVSVWTSKTNSYTYYIGRKLVAEYAEDQRAIAIRPDDGGASGLVCTWDRDNNLKAMAPKDSGIRNTGKECERLTRELVTALGTTHNPGPTPEEIAAAEAAKAAAEAAAKAEAAKAATVVGETKKPAPPPAPVAPLPTTVEIAKTRMAEHKLALWQNKNKTYNFFVGGVLDAEYAPGSETLTITTGAAGPLALTCKYDADNALWVKVDKSSVVDNPEATCDKLVNELAGKLQR